MTSKNYFYTRAKSVDGKWNINNPNRKNGNKQIYLSKEAEEAFAGKTFVLYARKENVVFSFNEELTAGEKQTLDDCVTNHKNNS